MATSTLRMALDDATAQLGNTELRASQHQLASAPLAAARNTVLSEFESNPTASAILRSSSGPGAATWLFPPTEASHHQTDAQFAVSIRHRLGFPIPGCQGSCQHRRPNGEACNAPLDPYGTHARYCPVGGWLVKRHDEARDIIGDWCEEHHCLVQREVTLPSANPSRPEARMDLVVYPAGACSPIYVDVSIVSAVSREALSKGSAHYDGKAAEIAERAKRRDYPLINVTPFIVDDHGRLGPEALSFVRRIAPTSPTQRSKAISDLYHRLSAQLQRAAADAVLSAIAARPGRIP